MKLYYLEDKDDSGIFSTYEKALTDLTKRAQKKGYRDFDNAYKDTLPNGEIIYAEFEYDFYDTFTDDWYHTVASISQYNLDNETD